MLCKDVNFLYSLDRTRAPSCARTCSVYGDPAAEADAAAAAQNPHYKTQRTDYDSLRETYRFIRTAEDDAGSSSSWEVGCRAGSISSWEVGRRTGSSSSWEVGR